MQNENGAISTWDRLMELGFLPDEEVISDIKPGLSFDFGNFKLSASGCINMRFKEVVLFYWRIDNATYNSRGAIRDAKVYAISKTVCSMDCLASR